MPSPVRDSCRTTACRSRRAACRRTDDAPAPPWPRTSDCLPARSGRETRSAASNRKPPGPASARPPDRNQESGSGARHPRRSHRNYFRSLTTSMRCSIRIERAPRKSFGATIRNGTLVAKQRLAVNRIGHDDVVGREGGVELSERAVSVCHDSRRAGNTPRRLRCAIAAAGSYPQ